MSNPRQGSSTVFLRTMRKENDPSASPSPAAAPQPSVPELPLPPAESGEASRAPEAIAPIAPIDQAREPVPPPYATRPSVRRRGEGAAKIQRNRVGLKATVAYINVPAHRQLKRIANDHDMTIEDLVKAGLNMVFEYYKLPRMV